MRPTSPTSLYLTGNFENFNDAGLERRRAGLPIQGNIRAAPGRSSDVGSYYTTNKIVYLSPQIFELRPRRLL